MRSGAFWPDLNCFLFLLSCAVVYSFALAGPKESGGANICRDLVTVLDILALEAVEVETASFILFLTVDNMAGLVASASPKYCTVDTLV